MIILFIFQAMKKILAPTKDYINSKLLIGESTYKITKSLNISQSIVVKIVKILDVELPKKIPSRPGKVSNHTKRYLVNRVILNYFKIAVKAKKYLGDYLGIEITSNRVREILYKIGLKGVIKKEKALTYS